MSKNDKASLDAQKAQEEKEAKKKLKAAEKAKPGDKDQKEKAKKNTAKKVRKWLKDFRGEIKKIVWPDFKTVMKNTGIVLLTVVIIGAMVWVLDYALSGSVRGLKTLAQGVKISETMPEFDEELPTEPETTAEAEDTTEAETEPAAQAETEPATEPVTEPATEPAE